MKKSIILAGLLTINSLNFTFAQSKNHWQKSVRELHYKEDKGDFLLVNGKDRFNRALYGNNLASRVEAGDLPEFALYLPGMGGNLQFVIQKGNDFKKLISAEKIETRYRPGSMIYIINDPLLGKGNLKITVLAQDKREGLITKLETENIDSNTKIHAIYGGASGTSFSRNGDIGADPESGFYLLPEYCINNQYQINKNQFELSYQNKKKETIILNGTFSHAKSVQLTDAKTLEKLSDFSQNKVEQSPIVYATYSSEKKPNYIQISKGKQSVKPLSEEQLKTIFNEAEQARQKLVNRIQLKTPDKELNNFGATLATAADGVWESPTFLHGAVAWRMRLNAWRGAYTADVLSWHDRAKEHFESYSNSQVLEPKHAPVEMDTLLNLARHAEKMGTSVFSSGYISRNPNDNTKTHHYNMNLVFFDQMFTHFNQTGDKAFIKKMWPTLTRHMDWEKRNFKRGDLYDAYCSIWASDALQYSGGKVTHTSAYNYRANREMAKLAKLIGEDSTPYQKEADAILAAMKNQLWIKKNGYFAEFKDALGNQILHDQPGIWSIYHVSDAYILNEFEEYQNLQYINNHIPHIPIKVKGENKDYYTLATTNWQPYDWSINNVALAENLQTALAYWQANRKDEAYKLWKGNLVESMYYGKSPGNFHQLSHYDAFRGELYRDFADPIGVAARTLTEGLFGVFPELLEDKIKIKPGFPTDWNFAEIALPDWEMKFDKTGNQTKYQFKSKFENPVNLDLQIPINHSKIESVKVNGKTVNWKLNPNSILQPFILLETEKAKDFVIEINYSNELIKTEKIDYKHFISDSFSINLDAKKKIVKVYNPQELIKSQNGNQFDLVKEVRKGTFFIQVQQGEMTWWQPINVDIQFPLDGKWANQKLELINQSNQNINGKLSINGYSKSFSTQEKSIEIPSEYLTKGTNIIELDYNGIKQKIEFTDWEINNKGNFSNINLATQYNERVTNIFNQKYLSPRLEVPTLQLPTQGIGNWCYPSITAQLDDSGLMSKLKNGQANYLDIPFNISQENKNIAFVSQWDNYPTSTEIPISGKGKKIYFMMAGTTNPMQSQMVNGTVTVTYKDGTESVLELKNPSNWWPIEQDLYDDNFAFEIPDDKIPYRVQLKTGELYKGASLPKYSSIKGFTDRMVEGGAATILDLSLDPKKELKSIKLTAVCNDVVIGLMSATVLK